MITDSHVMATACVALDATARLRIVVGARRNGFDRGPVLCFMFVGGFLIGQQLGQFAIKAQIYASSAGRS